MRRITFRACSLAILIAVLLVTSCKNTNVDPAAKYRSKLTAEDTTTVVTMATSFMDILKAGDIEQGMTMIKTLDSDGKVVDLDESKKNSIASQLKNFPVLDYTLKGYVFESETSNPVTFRIKFAEDPETGSPYMTGYALNMVKTRQGWGITIL